MFERSPARGERAGHEVTWQNSKYRGPKQVIRMSPLVRYSCLAMMASLSCLCLYQVHFSFWPWLVTGILSWPAFPHSPKCVVLHPNTNLLPPWTLPSWCSVSFQIPFTFFSLPFLLLYDKIQSYHLLGVYKVEHLVLYRLSYLSSPPFIFQGPGISHRPSLWQAERDGKEKRLPVGMGSLMLVYNCRSLPSPSQWLPSQ